MDINSLKIKEIITNGYIHPSRLPGYDYVINPYVGCPHACVYCYAEFMKRFTHHDETWGTFTDVKIRSISVKPVPLHGARIFISSITDCYNPLEAKYRLTRKLLEQLRPTGASITILTKSALVTQDIDVLQTLPDITVGLSMNTELDSFRQDIEPGASSVQERLNTLQTLHTNGIKTWLHMAPIFPVITHWKVLLEMTQPYIDSVSFENLKLRGEAFSRVMGYITQKYPHCHKLYRQIYLAKDMTYWRILNDEILTFCTQHNIDARVYFSVSKSEE